MTRQRTRLGNLAGRAAAVLVSAGLMTATVLLPDFPVVELEDALRDQGVKPLRREGGREGRWVLLDFGDVEPRIDRSEMSADRQSQPSEQQVGPPPFG